MKTDHKKAFSPLLHLTYVLQQLTDENLLKSSGVGLSQTRIMSVLSLSIPQSQRHVARLLQQTEANVSRQLKVMKRHGLVSVIKNSKDARIRGVKLTSKGASKYHRALKVINAQEAEMLKLLDAKEHKAFDQAANNLLSALNVISATTRKL